MGKELFIKQIESGDLNAVFEEVERHGVGGSREGSDQATRDALGAMIQVAHIREMKRLDKAAARLTKVGIGVAIVGVVLAAVQVWVSCVPVHR